jgi:hypothetical protein
MTLQKDQQTRVDFYTTRSLAKYLALNGAPHSKHAFIDMVASSSPMDLKSKTGIALVACLGDVAFMTHPQQINVMDKSNGKTIATIVR